MNDFKCWKCEKILKCDCETPEGSKSELNDLLVALGVTDEWRVDNIKETAMNRHSPKKSKRPYIKKILDEAFELLKQEGN